MNVISISPFLWALCSSSWAYEYWFTISCCSLGASGAWIFTCSRTGQGDPSKLRVLKYKVVCWVRRQITWDTDLWEETKPQTVCNWSTGHRTGDKTQNSRIRIHGSSSLHHPGILIGNMRNKYCLLEAKKKGGIYCKVTEDL